MYQPPQFRSEDPADALALTRAHPLARLISMGEDGLPFVSHLPLHAQAGEGGAFTLCGHVAMAPESHAALHAQYAAGNPDERALAGWMERLQLVPPSAA